MAPKETIPDLSRIAGMPVRFEHYNGDDFVLAYFKGGFAVALAEPNLEEVAKELKYRCRSEEKL